MFSLCFAQRSRMSARSGQRVSCKCDRSFIETSESINELKHLKMHIFVLCSIFSSLIQDILSALTNGYSCLLQRQYLRVCIKCTSPAKSKPIRGNIAHLECVHRLAKQLPQSYQSHVHRLSHGFKSCVKPSQ